MFCDPDQGEIFGCLPGFGEPKYEPIDGKKYVMGRISATYTVMKWSNNPKYHRIPPKQYE